MVLNITFKAFELERPVGQVCKFDWLQIHDGPSSSSHMIGRFCGSGPPLGDGIIISSQNSVYLWFRSDNSSSHDGFELDWKSIPPLCGGDIEATSHGTLASPGSPGNYPMNRDCYWKLTAPAGKRIKLNFFLLSIEAHQSCAYDYLAIYDGLTEESPMMEKFCNTSTPEPFFSPSNEVMLHFHSDGDNNDRGFQITYSVEPGVAGCGGLFTDFQGQVMSPLDYEDQTYPHNLECEYLIKHPVGNRIRLEFLNFHLEESDECKFDYLEIFQGKSTNSPLIGRFCGTSVPKIITSESNVVLLKFKSDWSTAHSGFSLKYRTICGGRFGEATGEIISPLYPEPYRGFLMCIFEIEAPLNSAIKVDFQDFDVEGSSDCLYDYVEFFDGHQSNETSIGRYCGFTRPDTVISKFNALTMVMETDGSINGRGFKANYSFINVGCGGIVKTSDAIIEKFSTEDVNANHDLDCKWLIVAPDGYTIQLNWLSFDLEYSDTCNYDYVEVYDNSSKSEEPVGRYCKNLPPTMSVTGNKAMIVFHTDSSTLSPGFQVRVNFVDSQKGKLTYLIILSIPLKNISSLLWTKQISLCQCYTEMF